MREEDVKSRKMLVLCPFPEGVAAGQRLKYEQYFNDWRSIGWDITVSPFMDLATWSIAYEPGHLMRKVWGVLRGHLRRLRDLARIRRHELVFIHMWVTPFGSSAMERAVRLLARRVVYDIEDNLMIGQAGSSQQSPNPLARFLKGPGKTAYLLRTSDHVIASSAFVRDYYLDKCGARACTYISSSVDTDRFVPARAPLRPQVTIGWTGTFSSRPYLDMLRPVFQQLAQRVDFKLRVIGNFDYDLPGVNLEVIRWTKEREVEDLQGIDIGVYPLPNDEWVLGKSGLKAIQYMAFALPTVATDAGMTPLIVQDGANGLLVRTDEEWLAALERLVRDPDLRRRLGQNARRDAVEKYSKSAISGQYRSVLEHSVKGT